MASLASFEMHEVPAHSVQSERPFRSCSSYVKELCTLGMVIFVTITASSTIALTIYFVGARESWKAIVVGDFVLLAVALMVQGYRADFIMVATTVLCALTGVISTDQALSGFASPGNIVTQCLLIIISGIQDSGVLEYLFAVLLGPPRGPKCALLRSLAVSAGLASFMSSGPVALVGCPPLNSWAPRAKLSSREVNMPFAFAAGIGQTLLTISSPVSLVIAAKIPDAKLATADPVPICLALCAMTILYGVFAAGPLLRTPSTDSPTSNGLERPRTTIQSLASNEMLDSNRRYLLDFQVLRTSLLLGRSLEEAGLLSLPGVSFLGAEELKQSPLVADQILSFSATAAGVARLRAQGHGLMPRGLDPQGALKTLGGARHQRRLFELRVSSESPLCGQDMPRSLPNASCLAVRRPGYISDKGGVTNERLTGPLSEGDFILVEAFTTFPDLPEVQCDFVAEVPSSTPPRHGRSIDLRRGWVATLLLLTVVVLSMLNVASLALLSLAGCALCVVFNIVHRDAVFDALNIPLYLLIAGGIGLGEAMESSGLAQKIAELVVSASVQATNGSPVGVLAAVGLIAAILCNMMSNTATAAIMAPIVVQVCITEHLPMKTAALVLIYSSNAAFCTPFGTAPNIVVQPFGPYTFGDYVKFGMPLQVLHALATPLLCCWLFGASYA